MGKITYIFLILIMLTGCNKPDDNPSGDILVYYPADKFVMGADLSFVNQILDHGGVYKDSGKVGDPFLIFKKHGANVIRFRLFHNPAWTKEVYGANGTQMYSDFNDVKKGIEKAKAAGLKVCLDFHYSDTWAGTADQIVPDEWQSLTLSTLHDSLYNYTLKVLTKLGDAGLMPDYVQPGNEINPGLLLPYGNRWDGKEADMIYLLNGAISAIRQASMSGTVKPQIIVHIAQPENVSEWLYGLAGKGLTDYDIIGFSYYYMWSSVAPDKVSNFVSLLRTTYGKKVMIMETTYPWTTGYADNYNNIINTSRLNAGYPATEKGQYDYFHTLAQEVIDGGGTGLFAWEPAWITSQMKDKWGTGSSWECNTFFNFEGNTIKGMAFMTDGYNF
jgi:arabinogalactan endo-1,4-beta-galactosidase